MRSFQAQTHYEVLEVSVGAKSADIESAFARLMQLYSDEQVALYGLVDAGSAAALRKRLQDARDTLIDDARRDAYDAKIGLPPREVKPPPRPVAPPPRPAPAPPAYSSFAWVTASVPPPAPSAPGYSFSVPLETPRVASPPPPAPVKLEPRGSTHPTPRDTPVVTGAPAATPPPGTEHRPSASPPQPVRAPAASAPAPELVVAQAEPPAPLPPPASGPPPLVEPAQAEPLPSREASPAPPEPEPVAEVPAAPHAPLEDVPRLADDAEVSIVPARATPSREFRVEPRPKPYEVPPDVEFNGDLLRQVRMARGISLAQLSDRTRIGLKHLENLEGDRYDALPAGVYLRGMLMSMARELGLDGLRVSKSYMTFVDAHRSKG